MQRILARYVIAELIVYNIQVCSVFIGPPFLVKCIKVGMSVPVLQNNKGMVHSYESNGLILFCV